MSAADVPSPRAWTGRSRGGRWGNGFFVLLVRLGGLRLAPFFVAWVALWFVVAAPTARRASMELARRLAARRAPAGRSAPPSALARLLFAYRHFFTYGLLLVDRLAILGGRARGYRFTSSGLPAIRRALAEGRGAVLLTAHVGNWEIMGHLLADIGAPVVLVMYAADDDPSDAARAALERARGFRVIRAEGSPATAAAILSALRAGCCVGMMGDRVLAGRALDVPFLGGRTALPVAPLAVAAAAGAPIFHVFALREGPRRYAFTGHAAAPVDVADRAARPAALQRALAEYAGRLETVVAEHPWQWGNFFPFWLPQDAGT